MLLDGLPKKHFKVVLADPPWRFKTWNNQKAIPRVRSKGCKTHGTNVSAATHYTTMPTVDICRLPVWEYITDDAVLFLWMSWPQMPDALKVIEAWGFSYKTAGFDWTKANATQQDMFAEEMKGALGIGYWTRANTEPCLLATRGKPKRLHADVRMAIIEPRREHSRKPDVVHSRIERLVEGPYLEMFARQHRNGWTAVGDQATKFGEAQ